MDKEMYKQLTAEYMRREAELLINISELKQQALDLTMENAKLKDMVLDNGGDYTEDFEVVKLPDSNDFEVKYKKASRGVEDTERTVVDTNQMSLFND